MEQYVPKKKFGILKEPPINGMVKNVSYVTYSLEKVQDMGDIRLFYQLLETTATLVFVEKSA